MKSRKTRIEIFVAFALQCRVECPSVAFFIVYLCPSGKYSSETIEKLTLSYTFLYCEKQFRYLILVCMFPIAGACAEFSCRPEIRRVALLPFLYSVLRLRGLQRCINCACAKGNHLRAHVAAQNRDRQKGNSCRCLCCLYDIR